MGKIGRNEPCSCGSGKKYKICCLEKKQQPDKYIIPELSSLLHIRCIVENRLDVQKATVDFNFLFKEFISQNESLKSRNSIDFFSLLEQFVEDKIIDICSSYSSYEMFFWHRRIHPIKSHPLSSSTFSSRYELVKKVIFLYGNKKDIFIKKEIIGHESFIPKYIQHVDFKNISKIDMPIELIDVLNDLYRLEELCLYYIYIRNNKRIFQKGGVFSTDDKYGFSFEINEDMSFLINLYDKRSKKENLLTQIGTYSDDFCYNQSDYSLVCLQTNFNSIKQDFFKNVEFKDENDTFNFIVFSFNFYDYYIFMKELNPVVYAKYSFYIEELLSIILYFSNTLASYISMLVMDDEKDDFEMNKALQVIQRGYLLIENDEALIREYFAGFFDVYKKYFNDCKKPIVKNFREAFNFLFFSKKPNSSLEEELLNSFMFNSITTKKIVVDCTSFFFVLRDFLDGFKSIDGEFANLISKSLESVVNEKIIELYGKASIIFKGEIKDEHNRKKEIDSSFIIDEFLFLIECKSLSVSHGSILGEGASVDFRKRKIVEFLNEAKEKALFIQNSSVLKNTMPAKIKYIIPLVITSFPEYIWYKNDDLFLSDEIPRILIVDEIELIADKKVLENLAQKQFSIKI